MIKPGIGSKETLSNIIILDGSLDKTNHLENDSENLHPNYEQVRDKSPRIFGIQDNKKEKESYLGSKANLISRSPGSAKIKLIGDPAGKKGLLTLFFFNVI